jgi:hypothetical protein
MWPFLFFFLSILFLSRIVGLTTTKEGKGEAGELVVSRRPVEKKARLLAETIRDW